MLLEIPIQASFYFAYIFDLTVRKFHRTNFHTSLFSPFRKNIISPLCIGSTTYTCMLNDKGGIMADLTVSVLENGDGSNIFSPVLDGKGFFSSFLHFYKKYFFPFF